MRPSPAKGTLRLRPPRPCPPRPALPPRGGARRKPMPRHRLFTGVVLAAGTLAGSALYRRRAARQRERVDLYAGDGSMASIADGAPEATRLLRLARDLIHVASSS